MANINVPVDGRAQYSFATVAVANASLGRMPWAGVEQVGPDRYVVAGSWPTPTPTPARFSPSVAAAGPPPDERPKSAASALWPNLPSG
jgi:hypothetical protein